MKSAKKVDIKFVHIEVDKQVVRDNLNFIKGRVSGWNDAIDACERLCVTKTCEIANLNIYPEGYKEIQALHEVMAELRKLKEV